MYVHMVVCIRLSTDHANANSYILYIQLHTPTQTRTQTSASLTDCDNWACRERRRYFSIKLGPKIEIENGGFKYNPREKSRERGKRGRAWGDHTCYRPERSAKSCNGKRREGKGKQGKSREWEAEERERWKGVRWKVGRKIWGESEIFGLSFLHCQFEMNGEGQGSHSSAKAMDSQRWMSFGASTLMRCQSARGTAECVVEGSTCRRIHEHIQHIYLFVDEAVPCVNCLGALSRESAVVLYGSVYVWT